MPFESAKCPNCGAEIIVPSERIDAICMYCGSQIRVKEAVQKYILEIKGNVSVSGLSSVENDIIRARQSIAARDYTNAFNYFCQAIDKQANCFEAWHGALFAITQSLSCVDLNWVKLDGGMSIGSIARNCMFYAPPEYKILLVDEIKKLKQLLVYAAYWAAIERIRTIPQHQYSKRFKKKLISRFVYQNHIDYINYIGSLINEPPVSGAEVADINDLIK